MTIFAGAFAIPSVCVDNLARTDDNTSEMPCNFVKPFLFAVLLIQSATTLALCFDRAGEEFGVDPLLLRAIASVESSMDPMAVGPDGRDLGLMQVRDIHITDLEQRFGLSITREHLFEPCFNVRMGAWVLATRIQRYGPIWEAVGSYNARSRDKRDRYIARVQAAYAQVSQQ